MDETRLVLITIVAEPVLEESITTELLRLGATGYTIGDVRGRGSRGMRSGDVPGTGVRIETIVGPDTADAIMQHVQDQWFPLYSVIAWRSAADVVRAGKYGSP